MGTLTHPGAADAKPVLSWVLPHSVCTAEGHLLLPGSTGSMAFAGGTSLGSHWTQPGDGQRGSWLCIEISPSLGSLGEFCCWDRISGHILIQGFAVFHEDAVVQPEQPKRVRRGLWKENTIFWGLFFFLPQNVFKGWAKRGMDEMAQCASGSRTLCVGLRSNLCAFGRPMSVSLLCSVDPHLHTAVCDGAFGFCT